jgi:amino acid transporter
VHPRYHTPAAAILAMAIFAAVLVLGVTALTETGLLPRERDHFNILTDFAMFGAIIFETMAILSIFIFRRRYPDAERPYRCWGYPVVPVLYVILPIFVLICMFLLQWEESRVGLAFILLGAVVYGIIHWRQSRAIPDQE